MDVSLPRERFANDNLTGVSITEAKIDRLTIVGYDTSVTIQAEIACGAQA